MTEKELIDRIAELEEIEKLFNALFNRTNDGVFLINLDGTYRTVNRRAVQMLGYNMCEILGKKTTYFIDESEHQASNDIKDQLLQGKAVPIYERKFKRKDGTTFFGENDVTLVRDKEGKPQYFFSVVRDVSEHKKSISRLTELARIDALTKLNNRRSMMEKLNQEKVRFNRSGKPFIIVLADIDNFKSFNDNFGHDCGDFILEELSRTIVSLLRKQDIAGRWGGEEFLFVFPETDRGGGEIIAELLCRTIGQTSYNFHGVHHSVTLTLGGAEFNESESIEGCIKKADIAMYRGKSRGKNCVVFF